MLPRLLLPLLCLTAAAATDLSSTAYLAGRAYRGHPEKDQAVYAGAHAALDGDLLRWDAEIDHSRITADRAIEQYDATLVIANGRRWEPGQLRLGIHLISSTDPWTDQVYGAILGTAWRLGDNLRCGIDGYVTWYRDWDDGLTVAQASPWIHYRFLADNGWWLADRGAVNGILLSGVDAYTHRRSSDFSLGNSFQIGRGPWALGLDARFGHFRFGHEQAGFVVNNSPDDLQSTLGASLAWYPSQRLSLSLRYRRDDLISADGSTSTSDLLALLATCRF